MNLTNEELELDTTDDYFDFNDDNKSNFFDEFKLPESNTPRKKLYIKPKTPLIVMKSSHTTPQKSYDMNSSVTSTDWLFGDDVDVVFPSVPSVDSSVRSSEFDVDVPVVSTTASVKVVASSMDSVPASDSRKSSEKVELVTLTTKLSKENVKYVKVLKATEEIKNISTFIDSLIRSHRNTQKAEN